MMEVPIMVTEPGTEEPIHWVGKMTSAYSESGEKGQETHYYTACGKPADDWPAILSYDPTCPECLAALSNRRVQ